MTATAIASAATPFAPPDRGRVGYVVLIALAWFQVAVASHQFEHVTGDLFEACTVCKHLERQDSAAAQEPAATAETVALPVPIAGASSLIPAEAFRLYHPRAPPAV